MSPVKHLVLCICLVHGIKSEAVVTLVNVQQPIMDIELGY